MTTDISAYALGLLRLLQYINSNKLNQLTIYGSVTDALISSILNKCNHVTLLILYDIHSVHDWAPLLAFHELKNLCLCQISHFNDEVFEQVLSTNQLSCLSISCCNNLGSPSIVSIGKALTLSVVEIKGGGPGRLLDLTPLAGLTNLKRLLVGALTVDSDFLIPICCNINGLKSLQIYCIVGLKDTFFSEIHRLTSLTYFAFSPATGTTSNVFSYIHKLPSLKHITFPGQILSYDTIQVADENNLTLLNCVESLEKITIMSRDGNKEDAAIVTCILKVLVQSDNGKPKWALTLGASHSSLLTNYVLQRL